jgi:hypothetical protein
MNGVIAIYRKISLHSFLQEKAACIVLVDACTFECHERGANVFCRYRVHVQHYRMRHTSLLECRSSGGVVVIYFGGDLFPAPRP